MSITSTKGLKIWLSKSGVTTTDLIPTSISATDPTEITVADTTDLADGNIVEVNGTDYPELDGKLFIISNLTGTTFELLGADTTNTAGGVIGDDAKVAVYQTGDMQNICLSSIDISPGSTNTIDISTFCAPGASLPGNPTPGTITLNGYVDIEATGYKELIKAAEDGDAHMLKIDIPNQGYIVGKMVIGSISWGIPIEGSVTYAANASMSVPMKHVFEQS